ncbi:MAG: hypothetical protein ACE5HI_20750 [bacterium]
MQKLNALALGYSGAIISAVCMLLLGILGKIGLYTGAVTMMSEWHMFFSLSIMGIVGGMIEAAIISFIVLYAFAIVYNKIVAKKG